jgi:hypothetical protein
MTGIPFNLLYSLKLWAKVNSLLLLTSSTTYSSYLLDAGVERSFSTTNRVCNRLRQRLTPEHMSNLMLISHEGPEKLTRSELIDIVYTWHTARPRKLQIPSQSPIIHHDQMNK